MIMKFNLNDELSFEAELPQNVNDMPILATLGYREARNWALNPDNHRVVREHLTAKEGYPSAYFVEARELFETFCKSVWGQKPPDASEFFVGFCVGVHVAVDQFSRVATA